MVGEDSSNQKGMVLNEIARAYHGKGKRRTYISDFCQNILFRMNVSSYLIGKYSLRFVPSFGNFPRVSNRTERVL